MLESLAPRCCEGLALPASAPAEDPRESVRLDLNADVVVRLDHLDRHVKLFLVDISRNGARFRSGMILPLRAGLSFKWTGPSRDPIVVHGHVADLTMVDKRTAEYAVRFTMPLGTRDQLARALVEVHRRKGSKPAEPVPQTAGEKRQAYRAVVRFPIEVRVNKRGRSIPISAEARDLSIGGIRLVLSADLDEDAELELGFSLPVEDDVNVPKVTREVFEVSPFGPRRIKKSAPRLFEPIQAKARIATKIGSARDGSPLVGIRFVAFPSRLREEIARWIHAHQLKQLRSMNAAKAASGIKR